jgi:NADH:ubiquinone oxidoreductase subunit 6 (subunit J)
MNKRKVVIGVTALLFLGVVVGSLLMTEWPAGELADTDNVELGLTLFNDYGIAVLMVSFVLFVALLGGVFIAQEEER